MDREILLLGATGNLGKVLLPELLDKNYKVKVIVRSPQKLTIKNPNLTIIVGDVTDREVLTKALKDISCVISVLGHGFRTKFPIQKRVLEVLVPLMEKKGIKRLITITGAGLTMKGDTNLLIGGTFGKLLGTVDPYRMEDAKSQQQLLDSSSLDWTVIRTPIHNVSVKEDYHVGYRQPMPWQTVSRYAVANCMIDFIENNEYVRKSPIVT